ncbi:MAG: VWA domain-containing protein [Acidobacteria bacterium]|nr:MAG: VWA domain-containing protein [Acidobacteriota bacterium]
MPTHHPSSGRRVGSAMRASFIGVLLVFVSVGLSTFASFPAKEISPGIGSETDRLIRVNVSVWDTDGRPVKDLAASDFRVFQDGTPLAIRRFMGPTTPLRVMILVDTSGSMRRAFARLQAALLDFVSSFARYDEIALVSFTRDPFVETDFSIDVDRLRRAISKLQLTRERIEVTWLFDALPLALDELQNSGERVRTALVLVTDGLDRGSHRVTKRQLLQMASRRLVSIYVVQAYERKNGFLEALSGVTGARVYRPDKNLERHLEQLARHLSAHYFLGLAPPQHQPKAKRHSISVTVDRPDVTVVAPTEYHTP